MKKSLFFVAVATLFIASCQKEINPAEQTRNNEPLTFKASIEQLQDQTKGTINASNQLVWAAGDQIGIYFDSWGSNKNQSFTLSSGEGSTEGEFTIDTGWSFTPTDATAAFYPWDDNDNAGDGTNNNVSHGTVYFTLHEGNYGYSNGKMITPLVASLSSSSNISFKHAGAAVKVHINNVPAHSKSIGMSVEGQQVHGYFHIDAANAGTGALEVNGGVADNSKNSVWLNYWNGSQTAWDFIFPVPELTKPKLTFSMFDDNNIEVWHKSLKAQSSDLHRGDILVMPAISITPYADFTKDATTWTYSGKINGSAWVDNVPMYTNGKFSVLSGLTFAAGDEFKIRKNKAWDESYPASNKVIDAAGTYDIIFNIETKAVSVVAHQCPYPAVDLSDLAGAITIDGTMSDWTFHSTLTSDYTSRIRSWKFSSDSDRLYFYLVLRKDRMSTAAPLKIAFDWNGSGSYTVDDYSDMDASVVFQPFTNVSEGTPTCVDGTLNAATINGTDIVDAGIVVHGLDPNPSASGESADYYIEFSIPKSKIPSLPASGSIQVGATYAWYETGLRNVSL